MTPTLQALKKPTTLALFGLTIILSYFTYFNRYWYPADLFWDENYHIASAEKYLNNVFFMEQHPPLGKLLIALGEKILHPNERTDHFIGTDYGKELPKGFSFAGYRLFPALMGWMAAAMLFLVFLMITRSAYYAFFLDFLYVFDNAQIVHNRGAMLEGPLMFFTTLTLLVFLITLERLRGGKTFLPYVFALGVAAGLTFMTKVVGLIVILLLPALLYWMLKQPKNIIKSVILFTAGFALVFVTVWQIHFSLGDKINDSSGTYTASPAYLQILKDGTNGSLRNFPIMVADSLGFSAHYNKGVPGLNLCKADENGSPFFYWPFGARAINYRWNTPDSVYYQYLYLQSNPVGWALGLFGLLFAGAYLVNLYVFGNKKQRSKNHFLIITFLMLYAGYMGAISQITRVMYLYHYFIPLVFSYVLFGLMFQEIHSIGPIMLNAKRKLALLIILASFVASSFLFYSPLTYYIAINKQQFQLRNVFKLWDLRCVNCDRNSGIYDPS